LLKRYISLIAFLTWKWLKTTAKVDKFKNMSVSPVKDKNGKFATSTKEQLEVRHNQ